MPDILGIIDQKGSGNMEVHFVAVAADHIVAVYVPVAVDEVINKAAILFSVGHDIM